MPIFNPVHRFDQTVSVRVVSAGHIAPWLQKPRAFASGPGMCAFRGSGIPPLSGKSDDSVLAGQKITQD